MVLAFNVLLALAAVAVELILLVAVAYALWRLHQAQRQIRSLSEQLQRLSAQVRTLAAAPRDTASDAPVASGVATGASTPMMASTEFEQDLAPDDRSEAQVSSLPVPAGVETLAMDATAEPVEVPPPASPPSAFADNWMVWVGGLCLGLAGIFLARHSLERGLIGPAGRVLLGAVVGLLLMGAGESLRRRSREAHPAFAGLVAGGSVMLVATLLSATWLYHFLTPATAFVLLAGVSFSTLLLALVHGPVLAALGLLGAYVVPPLVTLSTGHVPFHLGYALLVTASALCLLRYVHRTWLWYGVLAGALGWCLVTLPAESADGQRGVWLALVAWCFVALPAADPFLRRRVPRVESWWDWPSWPSVRDCMERHLPMALLALVVANALVTQVEAAPQRALSMWLPLSLLLLLASQARETLAPLPWIVLLSQACAWLALQLRETPAGLAFVPLAPEAAPAFLLWLVVAAVLFSEISCRSVHTARDATLAASLACLAPLILLLLGYLLVPESQVPVAWPLMAGAFGVASLLSAVRGLRGQPHPPLTLWLFFSSHFAIALTVVMLLGGFALTLALAAQLLSVAWLIRRFEVPALGSVAKLLAAIVLARVALSPWIASTGDIPHWPAGVGGVAALLVGLASRQMQAYPSLHRWVGGVALHLVLLAVFGEIRFLMTDGDLTRHGFTFREVAIDMGVAGCSAIAYAQRARVSTALAGVYRMLAAVLMSASLLGHALLTIEVMRASAWAREGVAAQPLWNELLMAFGVPVLIAAAASRLDEPRLRGHAQAWLGVAIFLFLTLEVRHLWQGSIDFSRPTGHGELYTYSAVWLLLALVVAVIGLWRQRAAWYRAGAGLLLLVTAKIFLVDMADLEGLLRVASFFGLGLALLGVAYLHERVKAAAGRLAPPPAG